MTNFGLEDIEFEFDYRDFENNRMYPPNHRSNSMKTVNDSHLKAIARAIHFMRSGITTQMTQKFRDEIQRDIDRLDEIHKFCRQQIAEPGLCLRLDFSASSNNGEKVDGYTNP
jgi:hypothetical protein